MRLVARRADYCFFKLNRHETDWVESIDDATRFASITAYVQCATLGRLRKTETRCVEVES